jgi:hypothetical protein
MRTFAYAILILIAVTALAYGRDDGRQALAL